MDQKEILTRLAELANELDERDMTREADAIAGVMQRVSQNQGWVNWGNVGRDVGGFMGGLNEFSTNYNPMDPRFIPNKVQQATEGVQGAFNAAVDRAVEQRLQDQAQNQAMKPQNAQPSQEQQNDLVKRYLGWGFDAAKRKGVAAARAAMLQHLQANKQSPAFIAQVMQAFDSQIASQKAFQGK